MKANIGFLDWPNIGVGTLGAFVTLLVFAVLSSTQISESDHSACLILGVIGLTMCAIGGAPALNGDWRNPFVLSSVALGVLALVLLMAMLGGVSLPLVGNPRDAFVLLAVVIALKVALTTLHQASLSEG